MHEAKDEFIAGQTRTKISEWEKITSDPNILKLLEGVEIEFTETPMQEYSFETKFSQEETEKIDQEIQEL